ncbi:MAG TPA: MFS transporter [Stellaceae bacterium]|jgi:MFS family permease|nr:MFS transporter [Stellaceae bacterium]
MAEAVAVTAVRGRERADEYRAIGLASAAHFANHFQNMVLPPLFPLLTKQLGIGFVELGVALTVANVVSVAAQLPAGSLVDRLGARRMLVIALLVSAVALIGVGALPNYPNLLLASAVLGLANSVFHPADYAMLSARIASKRLGRAFSVHTFSGFLGTAVAPLAMLALAATVGLGAALIAAGIIGVVAAVPLLCFGTDSMRADERIISGVAVSVPGMRAILTPTVLFLTGFFALLALSGTGISNFSVGALTAAFGTPLSVANVALTAYLSAQAIGVLAGGLIADRTRRHSEVAALGYAINAAIVLAIGTLGLGPVPLALAMAAAGLLGGLIMPSRDMLVRAAAQPGAVGRTFGIVTGGFNIAGVIGPLMFGYLLDLGAPRWVFGLSVILMLLTTVVALVGDRGFASNRRRAAVASAD